LDRLRYCIILGAALLAVPLAGVCQATGEQSQDPEAQIYAEALNALFGGVDTQDHFSIVVSSDSISMEPAYKLFFPSGMSGDRLEEDLTWRLPDAKTETIKNFARNSTLPHDVAFARELLTSHINAELASQKDLDAVFEGDYATAWKRFSEHYLAAQFLIQFSPIGFDLENTEAMVYVHRTCVGLCGSGELILLRRAKDNRWTVHRVHQFWVS
jgi:hypothetical protein